MDFTSCISSLLELISVEVTFEDGRKGVLSARVKIRDVATVPVAPTLGKAA